MFRDTLAKPVIKVTAKRFMAGAGHLLPHFNKTASAEIERGIGKKQGNILKFPLPQYGGEAGEGYNLKLNAFTANEHAEISTFGHLNYGTSYSAYDSTYEAQANEIKSTSAIYASDAMARKAVNRYMDELTDATNFVAFNPGNPGTSLLQIRAKMRRRGATGKPNIVTSTGMWTAIENVKHSNVGNTSIVENFKDFNQIEDVNGLPTYKTGDRAGLCLQVYSGCQSGCTIYVYGGTAAANRRIIRRGEVIEFCGVDGIDELTRISRGERRQFQAKCDVWADSTGKAAVQIDPELIPLHEDYGVRNSLGQEAVSGGRKNVTRSPKDGADIYVSPGLAPNSEYEQSIIWYDDMMVKITPELSLDMDGMTAKMRINSKIAGNLGNMWFTKDRSIQNLDTVLRWDWSVDYINMFPDLGYRLVGGHKLGDC
jgi:hypothetical protein